MFLPGTRAFPAQLTYAQLVAARPTAVDDKCFHVHRIERDSEGQTLASPFIPRNPGRVRAHGVPRAARARRLQLRPALDAYVNRSIISCFSRAQL